MASSNDQFGNILKMFVPVGVYVASYTAGGANSLHKGDCSSRTTPVLNQ